MSLPRGVEERIDWFLSHKPAATGMCAQHTWHSLGGDQGNPPAWGCSNANQCVDKVKASGRYWTTGVPPRGAWVGWKYGNNGHAAISNGDGTITTTDPSNGKPTGTEPLDYPRRWGYSGSNDYTVWSDQYSGVRFAVGADIDHGDVYLSKLHHGQQDSDSVKRLQLHLNAHPLAGGATIPTTGNYGDQTAHEVGLCQEQHHIGSNANEVGADQAAHLIAGCACVVHDDVEVETTPPPETVDPPDGESFDLGIEYHYSGKPSGELKFSGSYKKLDVSAWAPKHDGLTLSMLYANIDGEGEIRVRLVRDPDDATAYQTYYVRGGDNCLVTHVWFESGEAARKLWWEVCSMDGTSHTISTRYVKFATIPWEVVASASRISDIEATVKSWVTGG